MPIIEELATELQTFEANRERLLGEAPGKYALVSGERVVATYDTEADAVNDGYRQFGNAPFLVRVVRPVDEVANFFSPVVAA